MMSAGSNDTTSTSSAEKGRGSSSPKNKGGKDDASRDPIMQELCLRLECTNTNCTNICAAPIQQCSNGHLICRGCCLDIKKTKECRCPECGVDVLRTFSNTALASVADRVVVPCRGCNIRCKHSDLYRHLDYCRLKVAGERVPLSVDWSYRPGVDDVEEPDAGRRALALLDREICCNFCGEAAAVPIKQCYSGHVVCNYCLKRLRRIRESPTCPFCQCDMSAVARNINLEEMALYTNAKCRWCNEEMKYGELTKHLRFCEKHPIVCVDCIDAGKDSELDAKYSSWDDFWDHYKDKHLMGTPTKLSDMFLKNAHINDMLRNKSLNFIAWGNCLNESGEAVRVFPEIYYLKQNKTFYISIRVMAPAYKKDVYRLVVSSTTRPMEIAAKIPAISYRIPHKYTTDTPCLAISVATMKLLMEGGEGIKLQIELPENGPSLT